MVPNGIELSTIATLSVRGTMLVATLAWAAGEVLMRRSPSDDRRARWAWSLGVALALVHAALAFHFAYAWSHAVAAQATMQQAADSFGWGWSGGIYVNYAFLFFWLMDVIWWWAKPASHGTRSGRLETVRLVVFVFMFVNGAIVFASGVGRVVGIASVAVVLLASLVFSKDKVPA